MNIFKSDNGEISFRFINREKTENPHYMNNFKRRRIVFNKFRFERRKNIDDDSEIQYMKMIIIYKNKCKGYLVGLSHLVFMLIVFFLALAEI